MFNNQSSIWCLHRFHTRGNCHFPIQAKIYLPYNQCLPKNSSREKKYYVVSSGGAVKVSLHVQWCFLWWTARHISISCRHSRLFGFQLRLWRRWQLLLGVINSCGPLGALVLCCGCHTSTSWPDIGFNTNSCSSHPREVTVVRSSHV